MSENQLATVNHDLDTTIANFEKIKNLAIYLAESSTFTGGFEMRDKDGKVIIDTETGKAKINVPDVAIALLAGHELGLDIAGSLLLGKKLNPATYLSVLKGKELGIGVATSMEKIVSIPTQNGLVSYTMVDIISGKLLQGGVSFLPFIRDYAPFYRYFDFITKEELDLDRILDENDDLLDNYYVVTPNLTAEIITEYKSKGKIAVTKTFSGYFSKAKFVRTVAGVVQTHYVRYSTYEAQIAGLLPTFDAKGEILTKGKDNWIKNPHQMTNNRVISIGGRVIGADLIQGIYSYDEIKDAGLIKEDTNKVIDADAQIV